MIYIAEILLILVNLSMAWHHANLIKEGKRIHHGLWGGAYLLLAGVLSYYNQSIWLFMVSLFLRKLVFDLSLNVFRKLPLFYVTPEMATVKGLRDAIKKGKLIDWIHYKAFGVRSEVYMAFYLLKIIFTNIFFL